jgi:hypothetical protein
VVGARRSDRVVPFVDAVPMIDLHESLLVAIDTHREDNYQDPVGSGCGGVRRYIDWNHLLFVLLPY